MNAPPLPVAGRRFRLMQIGFGHIGMRRVHSMLRNPSVEIVSVVDVKRERLSIARELLGDGCHYDVDYQKAIDAVRPDGVINSTPNHLHAPITWSTLNRGVHVLCEKPLASSVAAAERCVELARYRGLVLKVGANHRFWRGVRHLVQIVAAKGVGQIQGINAEIGHVLPDERSEWYREAASSGGGTLVDNSPHALSIIEELLRIDGDAVASVRCQTSRDVLGLEVEDHAQGSLTSQRGTGINLRSTWGDGGYRMNLDVVGSRGRVTLTGFDKLRVETNGGREEFDFSDVPADESWDLDAAAFVDAARRRARPIGTGAEGLQNLRVIAAMYDSAARGSETVHLRAPVAVKEVGSW